MPGANLNNGAPAAELKDSDNELLLRFLRQYGADASYTVIAAQGIGNVAALREVVSNESLRNDLAKALEGEGATVGDKRVARFFRDIDDKKMDKLLAEVERTVAREPEPKPERVRLRATDELREYLGQKGFGPELMPIFESQGVTSLDALKRVVAKPEGAAYTTLKKKLSEETELDGKVYPGSEELAEGLKMISLPDVDAVQNPVLAAPDFRRTGLDDEAKNRYAQLKQAVQEVDELRQRDADAAKNLAQEISEKTRERLDSILTRVNARELLNVFQRRAPATAKELNEALDAVSDRLIAGAQDSLNDVINDRKTDLKTDEELARANCLRRGVLITATGIYECSGSDLVKGACGRGTPGAYEEIVCDYASEQSYQFAEKTVKESSHTYANSNSILGGFFSSSGIGAVSGAFQYAQSKMSSEARDRAEQTWKALKVKERSIYAPKAVVTLPRERIELSQTAVRYLKQIVASDEQKQTEYARLFLANFGGHIFRAVTLGGRYSFVAKAESSSRDTYEGLETALSEAQKKAGSLAAGFFGSFLLGGSTAHEDETTSASATGMTTVVGAQNQTVHVSIAVRGGLQEMPLDQWKQSLMRREWWRVIDRREAIAVWDLLRTTEPADLSVADREKLAALLERVWVQDVFLESLAESKLAVYEKFAQLLRANGTRIFTAKQLETQLRDQERRLAPPRMVLKYLTVTSKEITKGGEMVITLPDPWKIISGGGGTLEKTAQVLVESYPRKVTAPDGKVSWEWHLKTRASANTDVGDDAKAALTIGLILLYDPTQDWDVHVFERKVTSKEKKQEIPVGDASGYVLTGGGLRIDYYDRPTITGSGFPPEAAAATAERIPLQAYRVKTGNVQTSSSGDDQHWKEHSLTAYAIGIRAANGAAIEPVYSTLLSKEEQHLNTELAHVRGANGSPMIGGGAWVTGEKNFLSWSLPVLENSGRGLWKAYSADRAGVVDKEKMQLVTIGLKNVEARIYTENLPPMFHQYKFTEAYETWLKTKNGEVNR